MARTPKSKTSATAVPPPPAELLELDLMPPSAPEEQDASAPEPVTAETTDFTDTLLALNSDDADSDMAAGEDGGAVPALLPLVPIRDNVYFPHMIFPLFVGRDRSVKALEAAMEGTHHQILLAAQKQVATEEPDPDDIYGMGIVAEVMQLLKMPDNTVRVMLEGGRRVRLAEFMQTEPYFLVRTEPVSPIAPVSPVEVEALQRTVTQQFERLVNDGKNIPPEALVNVLNVSDPDQLADTVTPYLSLRVDQKQALLETIPVRDRLEKLGEVLHKEYEILEIQKNIRSRVEKEMGDNQREFILREQLKAIQQELGERGLDDREGEVSEYRDKIDASGMPEAVAERAYKELDRFEKTPAASPESGVIRNYLDWLVAMPWDKRTEETLDITEAETILNEDHYGLDKVKERILEFLAVRKLAGSSLKGPILCFVGPPGVGKTSLGRSVARALGRKFIRISLGGVRDEAEIRGHRRTYVGAMPGRIIQALKQAGTRNPVFMLDEIDKIGQDFRGDPSSALLEALDPEQNGEFSDHYLEVPFDLSEVLFVCTANLLDPVPPALRDRMEVISFAGYTEDEKLAIAERYLVPKQVENHGLKPEQLGFEKPALRRLIREYTREAGVRNLEREVGSICRKAARKVAADEEPPATVTEEQVKTFLGGRRYHWGVAEERDEVGAATGLVFTEVGGDTVSIEVALTRNSAGEGKGEPRLTLTGQLGDVMKESAQAAWTFVRSRFGQYGLPEDAGGRDIHVHVPAGAVPKDGPSAGVTMATALASAFSGRAVRKDVAMTGEITLRGKVLPVGGVKEKVLAAHRAGVRHILLPAENEKDLEDIPADVRADLCFEFVTQADEVLRHALVAADAPAEVVPA
jgi:ATP-dependent Lon protease